ncbi:MAG: hypothetical protein EOP61_15795 [Sphingomonadales bacterium]|nr:MAG: hypothetical protein EOP61_15795 [Sphingomonadales bacterium]
MQDGTNAGKAVLASDSKEATADAPRTEVDRRPYSELPDRGKKWPMPVRVVFITGSAAALWGLIFLGIKLI